ncbi:M1 family aminopeptidase [Candidatus Neomarinimicrobiota bacterium]
MSIQHQSIWNFVAVTLIYSVVTVLPAQGISYKANVNDRPSGSGQFLRQINTANDTTFNVIHYQVDLTIPLITNALAGTVTLTCTSLITNLDRISLDMDPTMSVVEVSKGVEVITPNYNSTDYKLILPFEQVVALNDTFFITVEYAAADNNNGFYSYNMSAYTDWAAGWFPCHDIPSDKATYDLHITVPYGVELASVGVLEERAISGDGLWETFNWKTDFPVAAHLVGMMMSRYYVLWSDWYISSVQDSIEVVYYIFARDTTKARQDFIHIVDAMNFYSNLFGPYPFEKYGMAETEPMYYGAMEHQSMSMISSSWIRGDRTAEDGLVHELAHQWWGDAVGFDDWSSLWLSEGFAEYSAALYTEYQYGNESFQALMAAKKDRYLQQAEMTDYSISDPIFDISHINIVYKKGAWVLHMLRHIVGTDNMWLILQNYFDTYKYSNATIADFQTIAEEIYGSKLDWFFDEWIYEKGYPRISADHVTNPVNFQEYECTITLQQIQPLKQGPRFTMPLDMRLTGDDGSLDTTVWLSPASQTFTFLLSFEPWKLELDPHGWVLMETGYNSLNIEEPNMIANKFQLENNFPNPFNSTTTINFELPVAANVVLNIYDLNGREVVQLVDCHLESGHHKQIWNARDAQGCELPTGIYIARMMTHGYAKSIKIVLIK